MLDLVVIPKIFIEFSASVLIWLMFAGLGVLWVIDGKIKKEQVVHAIFSCLTAWTIAFVIKQIFPTLRPFVVDGESVLTLTIPTDGAFPSMHTALSFALSVTIFLHDRKVGWFYLIAALFVGTGRVLANVHYPVDILGGAFIGTLVAVVVEKTHMFNLLAQNRKGRRVTH